MKMQRVLQFAAIATLSLGLDTTPVSADQEAIATVGAIIARTKLTRETYAAYYWNSIQHPGQQIVEEWSAEFNSGSLHRVETPRDRVVADCAAQTGTYLSLISGEVVTGPQVARVACGINTNHQFLAVETLGRVETDFGVADRVRVSDAENVRTYDISEAGIILRTSFETNDARHLAVLNMKAINVTHSLPSPDMFDTASLQTSFVSDRFRTAPKSVQ
jgi:hypothetical protein